MRLNHLTDDQLDSDLGSHISEEREKTIVILHHIREVDRRRLYCKYKYSSVFEYLVGRFKFTEDQAYRRISAMKLLKELPEIEERIESGALALTNLTKAQKFFRAEKKANRAKTSGEKLELLSQLENLSLKQADKVISRHEPEKVDDGSIEESFKSSPVLQAKLKRLREIKSNARPTIELHELIEMMADLALEKWDPMAKAERAAARAEGQQEKKVPSQEEKVGSIQKRCVKPDGRVYSSVIRHALYMRDQGCCRNCGSRRNIEIDHIIPVALGGTNDLENLRLLCRPCNQRRAVEAYGVGKMASYLRAPQIAYCA